MIVNPDILKKENIFKCNKLIANYLVYSCNLPALAYDEESNFYFAKTQKLKECLKNMPLGLKILSIFKGRR